MDKRLEANMRFLCDESRMLTGITVAYGTTTYSEWAQYGRAQEIDRVENGFIPAVRPLIPDTIYDLASLTLWRSSKAGSFRWMRRLGKLTRALSTCKT